MNRTRFDAERGQLAAKVHQAHQDFLLIRGKGPWCYRYPYAFGRQQQFFDVLPDDEGTRRKLYSPAESAVLHERQTNSRHARAYHLALAYRKGRPYAEVERTTRSVPPLSYAFIILEQRDGLEPGDFRAWLLAALRHLYAQDPILGWQGYAQAALIGGGWMPCWAEVSRDAGLPDFGKEG